MLQIQDNWQASEDGRRGKARPKRKNVQRNKNEDASAVEEARGSTKARASTSQTSRGRRKDVALQHLTNPPNGHDVTASLRLTERPSANARKTTRKSAPG